MFKRQKLSNTGEIVSGGTPKTKVDEYWNGSIPWITPKDLSNNSSMYVSKGERSISIDGLENSSAKLLPKGSVLFTSRAPIGYIAIAKNDVTTNQGFKSVIVNEDNYNIFIYYLLKNNINFIENHANGSTFKEISGSVMKNLEFDIPPLPEQKAIAHILSTLDEKIEVNNQINKTLENIAQTIFKQWFVDFEFPNGDGEPYKSSGGEMVESERGMIPKGWEVIKIKDYSVSMANGGTPKRNVVDYWDRKEIPWLKTMEIRDEVIIESDEWISQKGFDNSSAKLFYKDTVLIAMYGVTAGRIALLRFESTTNQACCGIVCSNKNSPYYLYIYLKNFQSDLKSLASGSAQQNLSKSVIENFKVILPKEFLLKKFHELCENLYNQIEANMKMNSNLIKLRDSLLPKLMSGEIRVPIEEN